ncbi:DUF3630 family protein [Vibrio sonorensis]|uniref:DUF3630 family protein n=1 Tax=Vibrio sonorensis TaxID=1004316 RepID=UPI0008DA7E74|nr:DUF3630 family protein [Vibrio sonorensis]
MADTRFGLISYDQEQARVLIRTPSFNFDDFPTLADELLQLLSAKVLEKQWDADLYSWLIDFEGAQLMLKAEHYSESVWIEALTKNDSQEELAFLASLFERGF